MLQSGLQAGIRGTQTQPHDGGWNHQRRLWLIEQDRTAENAFVFRQKIWLLGGRMAKMYAQQQAVFLLPDRMDVPQPLSQQELGGVPGE